MNLKIFGHHLGFKRYFLFIFLSENGHFSQNHWKFGFNYHKTLILVWCLSSQFSAIQHCFSKGQLISEWLFDVLNFPKRVKKSLNFGGGYQELSKIVGKSIQETKMYFEKIQNNLGHKWQWICIIYILIPFLQIYDIGSFRLFARYIG